MLRHRIEKILTIAFDAEQEIIFDKSEPFNEFDRAAVHIFLLDALAGKQSAILAPKYILHNILLFANILKSVVDNNYSFKDFYNTFKHLSLYEDRTIAQIYYLNFLQVKMYKDFLQKTIKPQSDSNTIITIANEASRNLRNTFILNDTHPQFLSIQIYLFAYALNFAYDDWIITDVSENLYLMTPHLYAFDEYFSQKYYTDYDVVSEEDLFEKVLNGPRKSCPQVKNEFVQLFEKDVLFSSQKPVLTPGLTIVMCGHGDTARNTTPPVVASFPQHDFLKLCINIKDNIPTKRLVVASCYCGGANAFCLFTCPQTGKDLTFPFEIITTGIRNSQISKHFDKFTTYANSINRHITQKPSLFEYKVSGFSTLVSLSTPHKIALIFL